MVHVAFALLVLALENKAGAEQVCVGDCDRSGRVTADELVRIVDIALGHADDSDCTAGDADGDSRIGVDEIVAAVDHALDGCPPVLGRTIDDLFEDVARSVPGFGGMFLGEGGQVLDVYLLDQSAEQIEAVEGAIRAVFGPIIPEGGIRALQGQYGFLELRQWYTAMLGRVLSTPGVVATDIDEAENRLTISIETADVEEQVAQAITELGIPENAVAIVVTGPIEPLTHTLQDVQSPRRGGHQIVRLINNTTGFGIEAATLGFNAIRSSVPGLVTNSHHTQRFWNLDTNGGFPPADFYQAAGYFPAEWVGTESVDTQAFPCPPPYPSGHWCRYSDSAFAKYNTGVAWDPGIIGKTTAPTVLSSTTTNLVLTVDHAAKFTVVAAPTQPYLVGLPLQKVGRTTGWTNGTIVSTCVDYTQTNPAIHPGTTVRLCQYGVGDPQLGLASFGDSGSPVFRVIDTQCGYVELYGILWGGTNFIIPPPPWGGSSVGKIFVFSPIGGVPFQPTGVQSPQDLGPLTYTTAAGMCTPATATRTPTSSRTPTRTATNTGTPRPTSTRTPLPPATPTSTSTATRSQTPTPRSTPVTGATATPTATPTGCVSGALPNLVPNPSFESFTSIPTTLGQLNLASPWVSPTNGSPDYFHSLASASSTVSVPTNAFGSQPAHSGRAYAGFHARPTNLYREYVEVPLTSPLVAGTTYQVSFYLSLADQSRWAVDKLGAYLSIGPVGPVATAYILAVSPQVNATGYVTNKTGWIQVVGSYTAVGGEDHLVIGNFLDNASTTPLTGQGGIFNFAYYYLDDVSVTLAIPLCTPTPTASVTRTPTPTATATPTSTRTRPPTRTRTSKVPPPD